MQDELKKWLVRRVECIRGEVDLGRFTLPLEQNLDLCCKLEVHMAFDHLGCILETFEDSRPANGLD